MSKRSALDPVRTKLLKLATAVADGDRLVPGRSGRGEARGGGTLASLRLIAALSQRLGTLQVDVLNARPARQALFQWGHLDVIEPLGSGTSAEVFRAYDPLLDIEVALKLSRPNLGRRATAEWIAEARGLARLRHPNIVAVHGVDVHGGRAGLWLDLVEGETLADYGERCAPLPARELCLAGIELSKGLAAVHDAGLLHRDIKPANLLRERNGRILITDFGAAGSAALTGGALSQRGTPLTMAPELIEGGSATAASDLYSLGVVLHWLATRRLPVVADDIETLRKLHRRRAMANTPVDLEDHPPQLVLLIGRLLACDPTTRPASAHEVERLLARALDEASLSASRPPSEEARIETTTIDFDRVVSREAELTWLQQEQRRAMLGDAHPVLLVGASGTGKTVLIRRFGQWLQEREGRLLHIALGGYPPGRRRLATLLERAIDPDPGDSEPAAAHHSLNDRVRRLLAETPSLALCLDDLEYADATEREQIRSLATELRGSTALLIGVLRTDNRSTSTETAALFGDGPASVLALEVFSHAQTEHAINILLGAPVYENNLSLEAFDMLHRLSGGNPFFLTELLRHLLANGDLHIDHVQQHCQLRSLPDSLPANLELAALERCRSLPDATRRLLDAAAVVGERFRIDTLAKLMPDTVSNEIPIGLEPALAAGLLEPLSPGLLRFRHGLIQRALYDAIDPPVRQTLHRACAALLEQDARPEARAWLSLHAERAGDPVAAFAAGFEAMTNHRLPEMSSLDQCERLHHLLVSGVPATSKQVYEVELRRLRALCGVGRLREAASAAEHFDRSWKRQPGSAADIRLRLSRAQIDFAIGHHGDAVAMLQPLLDGSQHVSARHRVLIDEARLLSVRAQAALGNYRTVETIIDAALATPSRDPVLRLEFQALHGWCIALQGRLREADEGLDRTLRLARDADPVQRANVLRRIHWVKLCRGRYQQAYALALAAHADFRSVGNVMGQAKMSMALGQTRLMQGLTEEALGFLNRTALRLEDIGDRHCEAETFWLLGRAYIELGRLDDADTHIERALMLIAKVGDRDDEFRFLIERARLRLAQERPAEAFNDARQARAIAQELDSHDGAAFAETEMAAAWLAQGECREALALCEPAATTLRRLEAGEHWRADWLLGRCRLACNTFDAHAAAAFASAATTIERTIAELDPTDQPRRERVRQARQQQLRGCEA